MVLLAETFDFRDEIRERTGMYSQRVSGSNSIAQPLSDKH